MPSEALQKFEANLLVDVDRIIDSHGQLNHEGMGRRGLGHITRSGVLMLCAAWELYLEELALSSGRILVDAATSPKDLPLAVQKELVRHVKSTKHELKPLDLAGDGWRTTYINHIGDSVAQLNTPKSANIDSMYKRLLGIPDASQCWSVGAEEINSFVSARGDIAHRGRDTNYITINRLIEYKNAICRTVIETDNYLADYLQHETVVRRSPWRRRR